MNANIEKITKIKREIEELEVIVKYLHRSAANLDDIIEHLKADLLKYADDDYLLGASSTRCSKERARACKKNGFDELSEMENDIWARLIADAHEES